MKEKTQLQIAQEIEAKWCSPLLKPWEYSKVLTEAKSNLEGLGCGKLIATGEQYKDVLGIDDELRCGDNYNGTQFCPDCLAKGVDKAKAIYERILNLNSEESEK